ncbi:MAG: hypothetical protein ACK47B_27285 [Armatimonadota bacterium]
MLALSRHAPLAVVLCLIPARGLSSPPRRELPLYCAGIVVGMSKEPDVRRMYGDGFFVADEGHAGGRYYVDPRRQVTLHVTTGVDRVIESVTYSRGVRLPAGSGEPALKRASAPKLTADEHFGSGHRLGDTAAEIRRQLGKPDQERRRGAARVLRYETDYETTPYVLYYELELRFYQDRLVSVQLYNGE